MIIHIISKSKKSVKNLLLVGLVFWSSLTYAQPGCDINLQGQVLDEHDGSVLSFAELRWLEQDRGVMADEVGRFTFSEICKGSMTLVVQHIGCEPDTLSFVVSRDTSIKLLLEHHTHLLDAIQVEERKPHKDIAPLQTMDLEEVSRSAAGSIAELASGQTGVYIYQSGTNIQKPMIRGQEGNRIAIVNDGAVVRGQQWGREHAPEVDAALIEEVEVVKGASSLRYGSSAIGGALKSSSSKINEQDSLHGWVKGEARSNGQSGSLAAKLGGRLTQRWPLYFQLAGSGRGGGDLKAPDFFLENTGTSQWSGQGRLGWMTDKWGVEIAYSLIETDLGILRYAHIGNLTDLEAVIERGEPSVPSQRFTYAIERPKQHVTHETTTGHVYWKPRLGHSVSLDVIRQYDLRQEYDNNLFSGDEANLQFELTSQQADLHYEGRFSEKYKLEIGGMGMRQANTYTGRFFIPNYERYDAGLYSIHHFHLDAWEFQAGARVDRRWQQAFMYREDTLYSPNRVFDGGSLHLGAAYSFGRWRSIVQLSRGWRPPEINELYSSGLHHGAAALEYGNESLEEERLWSLNLALDLDSQPVGLGYLDISAGAYSYWFDDYINLVPQQYNELTIRGAFPVWAQTVEDVWSRGVELDLKWKATKSISLDARGDWMISTNANDEYILNQPAPRLRMKGDVTCYENSKWKVNASLNWLAVARQQWTSVEQEIAPPPPAYSLFGAEIRTEWKVRDHAWMLQFRVENLLDIPYRDYLDRLRYFADAQGRSFNVRIFIPFG